VQQFSLHLLGGFAVHHGDLPVDVPPACQRLIALVALKRRPVHRLWVSAIETLGHAHEKHLPHYGRPAIGPGHARQPMTTSETTEPSPS
jgi:hypothetical protein